VRGIPAEWDAELSVRCSTLFKCHASDIQDAERLVQRENSNNADDANASPAPVRLTLRSKHVKAKLYRNRFKLKVGDDNIYVNNDLTEAQWTQFKASRPMYKQLRAKSIECCLPYGEILDRKGRVLSPDDCQRLLEAQ